jgi:hypothetical protein
MNITTTTTTTTNAVLSLHGKRILGKTAFASLSESELQNLRQILTQLRRSYDLVAASGVQFDRGMVMQVTISIYGPDARSWGGVRLAYVGGTNHATDRWLESISTKDIEQCLNHAAGCRVANTTFASVGS